MMMSLQRPRADKMSLNANSAPRPPVTALTHTTEVSKALMTLFGDPELGKKDARLRFLDAALELMQKDLITVPEVVEQIKSLPADPQEQVQWVNSYLWANQRAQFAVAAGLSLDDYIRLGTELDVVENPRPTANALGDTLQQPSQVPQPASTHEQTITAITHTAEISKALMTILRDPELGRKDQRSQILAAALELMDKGIATVPAVVEQIKSLPSDPQGQMQWVKAYLMAQLAIITG